MAPTVLVSKSGTLGPGAVTTTLLAGLLRLVVGVANTFGSFTARTMLPVSFARSVPSCGPLAPSVVTVSFPFVPFE